MDIFRPIDYSGYLRVFGSMETIAKQIKTRVKLEVGLNEDKWGRTLMDKWGRTLIVTFFHRLLKKGELIQVKKASGG